MKQSSKIWIWCNDNPIKTIIIIGVFIRIIIAILYGHITLYPDSKDYINLAERLLNFDLAGYQGERPPGYPLFLSINGISNIITVLLQSAMGVCTLIFAYKTLILGGAKRQLALTITLILACYLPSIFFEFAILTESLTLLIITLIFYIFFGIIQNDKSETKHYIWLALLCGYLVMIKMFYIYLACLLFMILIFHNHKSIKTIISKYLLVIIIPISIFLGWSYVNKINTGYFTSSTFYGFNIAQNCVWFSENTTPEYQEIGDIYASYRYDDPKEKEVAMTIWEAYPELVAKTDLSFPDLSKKLYDYSIATIKKNPIKYLEQVSISWRDFWKTSLYWEAYSFSVPQASNVILYICYMERVLLQLVKMIFVLLIPYNIFIAFRRKVIAPPMIITIVVFAASILQAFATYGTNSRFSYPFEILMITSVIINILEYTRYRSKQKATS
ncbi:glycosyltransferase family 39 protein [Dysgonomonas sp. Marseille-P4677]|uniref:glycosyltransferase family 39 protein n=1 Tax=Dysgonomonas sp. Marseille-P4677 TaxID=2364790 RepID=UPI0019131889|nr:glycosyltransferase family 39 protein [Dysgonomonas sp. Marseille-P4677]MBK5720227.1 glycosyltransferase family 39 protein [Dysgonomonas sp. Marseille-P4677]